MELSSITNNKTLSLLPLASLPPFFQQPTAKRLTAKMPYLGVYCCAGVSGQEEGLTEQQRQEAEAAALAAQQQQESLEHAQKRAQLEEATLPLMLDAMWAANVLDIETTLRHVCKKVRALISELGLSAKRKR